jgi:pimeloyl-ACP methyl ester carboxylesterase
MPNRSDQFRLTVALTLYLAAASAPAVAAHKKMPPPTTGSADLGPSIQMGSLIIEHCPALPAYCGRLPRPLDPAGQVPGTIDIGFQIYPRRNWPGPSAGTIVADEGGPGYATTGTADGYLGLFRPLLEDHDLLLMDNRGTGSSQPVNCPGLQNAPFLFLPGIAACGLELGHASDLYGSGLAADDLAALLDALGIGQVDLYGDSYGTFFSQAFAGRHPDRLRSLILDSAYPVIGESPWYPQAAPAMRNAFNVTCRRSLTCQDLPGDSLHRIEALLESLRAHPFSGIAQDGDGVVHNVEANATSLAFLAFSNTPGPVLYRDLDAAARAYLESGYELPLLRLLAENWVASPSDAGDLPLSEYSQGLYIAVTCSDYPFAYDLTAPPAVRLAQRNAAFAEEELTDPSVYGPFTIDEFNGTPIDYSVLDSCLNWPTPSPAHPPGQPVPPNAKFTRAPVLVLSGELDSLTPAAQGAQTAALFPNATQIIVSNSFHVTAVEDEDNCASVIALNFVRDLDPGDTSCASHITEVRMIPKFAQTSSELDPATAAEGNQGTIADLQVSAAAAYAAGDAIARWWVNLTGHDVGLRGGWWEYTSDGANYVYKLNDARWVEDVGITGVMTWTYYNREGLITANIQVSGPPGESGGLNISWHDAEPHAQATITGVIGGRKIAATMYAP